MNESRFQIEKAESRFHIERLEERIAPARANIVAAGTINVVGAINVGDHNNNITAVIGNRIRF
jgi:hypothetical protein